MAEPVRVVVGLGNPGERYRRTRHNIGFRLVDRLGERWGVGPERERLRYRERRARIDGHELLLLKPTTYMNRSGAALEVCPESAAAAPGEHLLVYDDVALPFGAIRFRQGGSAGGHRGVESVLQHLGTEEVPRLRLGVGAAEPGRDLAEYVLEPFSSEEEAQVGPWLDRAAEGLAVFVTEGPDAAMNRYNRE